VFDTLVSQVHRFGGSVMGFAGDAITCWFAGDKGPAATACALAMQQAMTKDFNAMTTPAGTVISLGMKAAVAAGPVRRFVVGDPTVQTIDVLAGATLDRMAAAEHHANRGEVLVAPEVVAAVGHALTVREVREDAATGCRFAVVAGLAHPANDAPWPPLPVHALTTETIRPWLLRPVYQRLTGRQDQFLAEIRPAVALFVRFGGIDFDSDEQAGPKLDAYIRWVQGILARYDGFLLQLTVGDKGCYYYASFGAPVTRGDDAASAVAAALEIQQQPAALSFVGPVQIGLSQGRMRTGAYGGSARSTYGVLGDEVNMAARLMQLAWPGQILVAQRLATTVAGVYQTKELGLMTVKGKAEPLAVAQILGRRRQTARKPVSLFSASLVGRQAELDQLSLLLTTAEVGDGQLLRIVGPAGIGKSHLTAAFAQQALTEGWRVVLGACQSIGREIPYHPWRQIFRAMFNLQEEPDADPASGALAARHVAQLELALREINPDWLVRLPLLGDLLNLPIPDNPTTAAFDAQLRREALASLVVDLLLHWARSQPLVILLEDVHWLDEASVGLAGALARVINQAAVVLAVVHRPPLDVTQPILPELDSLPNRRRLDLAELSPEGVAAVVASRLQGQPSALLLSLVQRQAQGNPFYVEELLDALRELGHLVRQPDAGAGSWEAPQGFAAEAGTGWDLSGQMIVELQRANCLSRAARGQVVLNPEASLSAANLGLPDSIHGLVLARLDRLSEQHRLTLKVASVIGRTFQFRLLQRAYPLDIDEETLLQQVADFEGREFVRLEAPLPNLVHIFKHNITREVTYDTMLETQQRELHRGVAEALEALEPESIEQLAYHYNRARVRAKAVNYLDQAARRAQREYANETALTYYEQALAWEDRWVWRKGQVESLHVLCHRQQQLETLERLASMPETPAFDLAFLRGQYFEAIADYPQAQNAIEEALVVAQVSLDGRAEMRCLSQLGLVARRQGDYQAARRWYNLALATFDEHENISGPPVHTVAQILSGLGIVHRQLGDFAQAGSFYGRALAVSRDKGNLWDEAEALDNLGTLAYHRRDFGSSIPYHRQALEIRRAIGNRTGEGVSLLNLAQVLRDAGDYGKALNYFDLALDIHRNTGNRWEEINVCIDLGILEQELGRLDEARQFLAQGLQVAREIGDEAGEAYLLVNLGLVLIDAGQPAESVRELTRGLKIARQQNDVRLVSSYLNYLGMAHVQAGNLAGALSSAQEALDIRQRLNLPLAAVDTLATLARLHLLQNEREQALDYAEQVLAILDSCGGEGPEFPQRDSFICYQIFSATHQANRARTALQLARDLVMDRANKIADPALRHSFLEQVSVNREIMAAVAPSPPAG
jgi:class 3 adenylate cyclase/tetratricopeptide (TPR) repeat protein